MSNWVKKVPNFIIILALAVVYLAVGYLVGYFQGYQAGVDDYLEFIDNPR